MYTAISLAIHTQQTLFTVELLKCGRPENACNQLTQSSPQTHEILSGHLPRLSKTLSISIHVPKPSVYTSIIF